MKKLAVLGAVMAASVALAPLALADDTPITGPGTTGCEQANAAVLLAAVTSANVASAVDDHQSTEVAGLKAAVEAAKKDASTAHAAYRSAYDKALAAAKASGAQDPEAEAAKDPAVQAALADVVAADAKLKKATDALAAGPGLSPADKDKLDAAKVALSKAIVTRETACKAVVVVTPTLTPAPTTTNAPSTTVTPAPTKVPVPSAIDTGRAL